MKEDDHMKWLIYLCFAIMYLMVTFFGLGPVLIADGSNQERMLTLIVVLAIYTLLTVVLWFVIKKFRK